MTTTRGDESGGTGAAAVRPRDPATAAVVTLAILAATAAVTWAGPVLKPFLVAVFLYYATQCGAKMLTRLGLGPRAAYLGLLLCALLATLLFGRLVERESTVFLKNWPKYESRITKLFNSLPLVDLPSFHPRTADRAKPDGVKPKGTQPDRLKPDRLKSDGSKADGAQTVEGLTAGVQADEIQADEYLNDGTLTDLPAATADQPAVSTLGEMFRQTSKETLDYVFHQGLGIAELFALVTVYLVFLFLGSRRLPGKIRRAFPGERGERLLLIGAGISDSMERFMAVKTTVGLGMAVSAGLIMYFFGLDHWLLWAFLFFASNYITYIGSIAALVPPFLLAFIDLNGPLAAAALAALLVVNRLIWIDIVEVRMSGRQLNLDPALMFLWLSYWGWVWGVLGLLLAYPMLAAVKIVLAHLRGGEGWAVMLSDE